jgi:hypothetical protein
MKKVCIQAGHQNTSTGATGAPNEMSFNIDIANTVSGELRKRGFEVKQTDSNADKDPLVTTINWDLFLAIHYDADIYGTGGYFVDYPAPDTDGATAESQRICKVISDEYGKVTGIVNHPERSNAKTRYYYIWEHLTAATPCNLIECGVGMHTPDDWQILHFDRPRVVQGIVRGICKALGVSYDLPVVTPPPVTPPPVTPPVTPPVSNPELDQCRTDLALSNINANKWQNLIVDAKAILYGTGFWWTKLSKLKILLPK